MGWGTGAWGTSPWGGESLVVFSLAGAFAVGPQLVRVQLSRAPKATDATDAGSVFNPETWTLSRLDTGHALTILLVEEYDPTLFVYDLHLLETLSTHNVQHAIAAPSLVADDGTPISGGGL